MPTGVALHDAREQLFAAAERVLIRDGVQRLTSRAITDEAEVSKGVLHRHFADLDDFLTKLVRDRIDGLEEITADLKAKVGNGDLISNLSIALTDIFTPTACGLIALISSRDAVRTRLRETSPHGVPLLSEATTALSPYLQAEQQAGTLNREANPDTLAFTLIGTGHLLFAGATSASVEVDAVRDMVEPIVRAIDLPQR